MKTINLHIKNMVCPRCIFVVQNELAQLGVNVTTIRLGYASVQVPEDITQQKIASHLNHYGLELLQDKEDILVENIKLGIRDYIQMQEASSKDSLLSEYLAQEIGKNYNFLSKLFSRHEGQTIETYYIHKRIERVKELVGYDELNLSEIAMMLGYSSVHYLSSQFKRVTGLSVSDYKEIVRNENRYYKNISEALTDLREKGYTYNFNRKKDCLECKDLCASFQIEELNISEFYRFDEKEDAAGKSVIYGITTKDGLKGLLIDNSHLQHKASFKRISDKLKEKSHEQIG
ncbi:MAG: AraC family transcriptional regulator [Cyclobacteriaceae bacterium]